LFTFQKEKNKGKVKSSADDEKNDNWDYFAQYCDRDFSLQLSILLLHLYFIIIISLQIINSILCGA